MRLLSALTLGGAAMSPTVTGQAVVDGAIGAAEVGLTVAGAPILRHWFNRWGATPYEVAAAMPGDELVPAPKLGYTRAVTITAPVENVWPWLVQIGHGRGGLYSFDPLENLVGCDIHSADRILAEHQRLVVGDVVRMGPPGYPCFTVAQVDPPTTLVLLGADPAVGDSPAPEAAGVTVGSTWQWQLSALAGDCTRVVVRQRLAYPRRLSVLWHVIEPIAFVMERRMLLGLRQRAERPAAAGRLR
jgi:hypothetical protein